LAAPANPELVKLGLEKNKYDAVLTERPADKITNEFDKIGEDAKKAGADTVEDVLTYAMFPKVAPGFFQKRSQGPVNSSSFAVKPAAAASGQGANVASRYNVNVNGANYAVVVSPAGTVAVAPAAGGPAPAVARSGGGQSIPAPVAGTVLRYAAAEGATVKAGDTILIIESMKMELEIKSTSAGPVHFLVPPGTQVAAQQPIAEIGGSAVGEVPAAPAPAAEAAAPVAEAPSGGTVIPAPVAGTVLRYAAAEGAAVKAGDTIVIIESMKMELEIKSTSPGSVHFLVPPGTQVASQQAIAEIK
jgi:oxaloacetate decarboxylase alpha subunit